MRKEISNLISDKVAVLILFIIPVVMICIVGSSQISSNLTAVTIWVIDEDNSTVSHEALLTFENTSLADMGIQGTNIYISGQMAPVEPAYPNDTATAQVNLADAQAAITTEYLDAYIILPPGFGASLTATGKAPVQVYYDCIDVTKYFLAEAVIEIGFTNIQEQDLLFERAVFYIPSFRPMSFETSINLLELGAPVFIGLMLFFSINLICTQSIVGDVPLQRLLTTPVYRSEVITGKLMGYSVIAIFQIIISMLLLNLYNVTMSCLWIDIFIVLLLNSITSVSMGLFISTISKTRLQASRLFLMFFFVLLILTYYVRSPIFLAINPMEQTRVAFSNLAFRGNTLSDVWDNCLNMILTAGFFYLITIIYIAKIKKEFV